MADKTQELEPLVNNDQPPSSWEKNKKLLIGNVIVIVSCFFYVSSLASLQVIQVKNKSHIKCKIFC